MESFINYCNFDVDKSNCIIKNVLNDKNTKYFYRYVFIYIHMIEFPRSDIMEQLFDIIKNVIVNVNSASLNPNISIYQNYRNMLFELTSRFLCEDFMKRLELFDIFDRDQIMTWLKDELEDNVKNDRYIKYYVNYCKRLISIDRIILHMKNEDLFKIFGISVSLNYRQSKIILSKYVLDNGIDELIDIFKEKNEFAIKNMKIVNTENTLYESIFSYNMTKIITQDGHNYIITPPEYKFVLSSKKNIYTNIDLSIKDLIEIYTIYIVLNPYFGTYKENIEKYLDSVEDDYYNFDDENIIENEDDNI